MFTHGTHMRIPMLHTPSAARPISSLVGESPATVQTEMHTNEASKHELHVNVESSQYINEKKNTYFIAVQERWEGFETAKGLPC